ncbi:hypothetical protein V502_07565 [Pseudogymnoascus sp. VKM F-4520 (FW-2644)]|nr:hypothetical protein V502_07565 [Pseudogymnoascus sp. VKM F-4520 (FW-2644)]
MAPTSNAATPPRRQSCNRCHGQKLRCTRATNSEMGACNRCLRQGAQCLYSSGLPKGRPSIYRLAGASPATSSSPPMPVTPVSPRMYRRLPTDPLPAANSNATATNTNANTDADGKANTHTNANPNTNTNANTRVDVNDDTITFGPLHASTWPWQAPLNWSDMLIDGSDQDSNLHSIVDPQTGPGAVFSSDFPDFVDSASSRNSDGGSSARGRPTPLTRPLNEPGHYSRSDVFDVSNYSINIDRSGSEFGIAQLSQLSTRLYTLYRSSCNLAEAAESSCQLRDRNYAHQSLLIDDTAFKSVTSWLVHVSANMNFLFPDGLQNPSLDTTTGDILHDAFSASHHLLEILRGLQVDVERDTLYNTSRASKSSSASTEGGDNGDFWASTTPQSLASASGENLSYFELNNGSSNYVRQPSQCHNTVVRHLVIACHTLLLNIHVAVLIVLQHDADLSYPPHINVEADAYMDATVLADIRLVLVLRLCSYLIKRQQQAVGLYLGPKSSPTLSHENDPPISHQLNLDASTAANREAMSDLEIEVQQRLERLRQTLRI